MLTRIRTNADPSVSALYWDLATRIFHISFTANPFMTCSEVLQRLYTFNTAAIALFGVGTAALNSAQKVLISGPSLERQSELRGTETLCKQYKQCVIYFASSNIFCTVNGRWIRDLIERDWKKKLTVLCNIGERIRIFTLESECLSWSRPVLW